MFLSILFTAILTFIASAIGTVTGFGLSTIMTPVLLFFYPFEYVLIFIGFLHLFQSLWKTLLFCKSLNWKLILFFGLPEIITSFIGAFLVVTLPKNIITSFLGILLTVYAIFLLINPKLQFKASKNNAILSGVIEGLLAGLIGIRGALRSAFLISFDLSKFSYIGTSGAISVMGDTTRVITYLSKGLEFSTYLLVITLLICIPVAFLGTRLGKFIVDLISENLFRKIVAIFLLLAGIRLMFFIK